ncbi:MAG TPA: hypothetical protein ENH19_02550 [Actinobacteria bacterium]|nr:hypothetical protein [Actinomycetes bacterium]HEX21517.1 hypothetical protein [Actinomycetota bacterium]
MSIFTSKDLKENNGVGGRPIYLAFKGKVYDLTNAFLWQGGVHEGHAVGAMAIAELSEAPHGPELLESFPVIGEYQENNEKEKKMDVIKILEQAVEAEQAAQKMYKQGVDIAEDAETRALFEQLTNWEQGHERLLKDRLATLKLMKDD